MGINAIALVLIASFAIDRIVTGILFLLAYSPTWRKRYPDPATVDDIHRAHAERTQKVTYALLAGLVGLLVAWLGQVRVLAALGVPTVAALDIVVSTLVFMGGSDQVSVLVKGAGVGSRSGKASSPEPIQIKGSLTLEQPPGATQISGAGESSSMRQV